MNGVEEWESTHPSRDKFVGSFLVFTARTKWATVRFVNDASGDNAKPILVRNVTYKMLAEGRKIRFGNPDFEMDNDKVASEKLKW